VVFSLFFIYAVILGVELPALIKNRLYKEIVVFMVFLLVGIYMSLSQFYGWNLYNPFEPWIKYMSKV